jgi:hypothetical protein
MRWMKWEVHAARLEKRETHARFCWGNLKKGGKKRSVYSVLVENLRDGDHSEGPVVDGCYDGSSGSGMWGQ